VVHYLGVGYIHDDAVHPNPFCGCTVNSIVLCIDSNTAIIRNGTSGELWGFEEAAYYFVGTTGLIPIWPEDVGTIALIPETWGSG
jgi:hypothetical protein